MFSRSPMYFVLSVSVALATCAVSQADFTMTLTGSGSDYVTVDVNSTNNTFTVIKNDLSITDGTVLSSGHSYAGGKLAISAYGFLFSSGQTALISGLTFEGYSPSLIIAQGNQGTGAGISTLSLAVDGISGAASHASSFGISVSESGFNTPVGERTLVGDFDSILSPGTAQVTSTAGYSDTDGITKSLTYTSNASTSSNSQTTGLTSSADFTLTDSITISNLGALPLGNVGVEAIVHAPAPSSLVLIATVLPLLGLLSYRRSSSAKPA